MSLTYSEQNGIKFDENELNFNHTKLSTVERPVSDNPKCQTKVVAYTNMGQNVSSSEHANCRALTPCVNADAMFYLCKSQFRKKTFGSLIERFPFLLLARNTIMLQHLVIQFSLHYLSSSRLREVKNKGKFQTFSSKKVVAIGSRLQEIPNILI